MTDPTPEISPAGRLRARFWPFRLRSLLVLALVMIPIALLGLILYRNWEALLNYPWQFRPIAFLAAFLLYTVALALAILTWGTIMNSLSPVKNWWAHIRVYSITNLARRIPGIIWFFIGRVSMYQEYGISKTAVSVGSVIEFLMMLVSGILVSVALWPFLTPAEVTIWHLLLILVIAFVLCQPRVLRFFSRLLSKQEEEEMQDFSVGSLLRWITMYGVVWLLGGLYLMALSYLVYDVTWQQLPQFLAAWCISGVVATVATLSPGGFGLREISLTALLAIFMPTEVGLILALLSRLTLTFFEIIWAITAYYVAINSSGLQELSQMGYRQ